MICFEDVPVVEDAFEDKLHQLTRIWSERRSGDLSIVFPRSGRRCHARFSNGGLFDRGEFMSLNAALGSGRIGFVRKNHDSSSDWKAVGKLLFQRAFNHAQRTPLAEHAPAYRCLTRRGVLQSLPITAPVDLLAQARNQTEACPRHTLRALHLMGLIEPISHPILRETTSPVINEEPFLLTGGPLLLENSDSTQMLRTALRLLREGNAAKADLLLSRSIQQRLDQPMVLGTLAIACWRNSERPLSDRVERSERWIRLACQLDPENSRLTLIRQRLTSEIDTHRQSA